jgi:hypothetical protein
MEERYSSIHYYIKCLFYSSLPIFPKGYSIQQIEPNIVPIIEPVVHPSMPILAPIQQNNPPNRLTGEATNNRVVV